MGAWGFQAFENDDALDWLEVLEAGGAEVVRQGLDTVADGYIEAPDGSVAVAAAEITAAAQGNPHGELPENVATRVTAHGAELTAEDAQLALEAVERVAGEESELAELWDEADEPEWKESLDNLSERLRAALRERRTTNFDATAPRSSGGRRCRRATRSEYWRTRPLGAGSGSTERGVPGEAC